MFDDDRARREIREIGTIGDCDYFLVRSVATVEPAALTEAARFLAHYLRANGARSTLRPCGTDALPFKP